MFNPALIKPAIGFVTGLCTSRVVGQVIRSNVTTTTRLQKIEVLVATTALGSLAGSAASNAVLSEIESVEDAVKGFKDALKSEQEK